MLPGFLITLCLLSPADDSVRDDTAIMFSVPSVTEFTYLEKTKAVRPVAWMPSSCQKKLAGDQRWINAGMLWTDVAFSVQYYQRDRFKNCMEAYFTSLTPLLSDKDTSAYFYLRKIPREITDFDSAL